MVRTTDLTAHDPRAGGGISRRSVLTLGAATAATVWLAANAGPDSVFADPLTSGSGHPGLRLSSSRLPFSFRYRGASSHQLLPTWRRSTKTGRETGGARTTDVTWLDPATGLEVVWSSTEYRGFATTSWQLTFRNTRQATLSPISDVLAMDVSASSLHDGDWGIRTANGSAAQPTDFEPYRLSLAPDTFRLFTTGGGRPTNGYRGTTEGSAIGGAWPYWNIDGGDVGLIASIGWPGQWAATVERVGQQEVRIQGGMANAGWFVPGQRLTDSPLNAISLPAGGTFTTPLAVAQPWSGGDFIDAQNEWRQWFLAHNTPRVKGRVVSPLLPTQANDYFVGQQTTVADELAFLNAYGSHHATAGTGGVHDYWWVDAGWYETPDDWPDPNTAWVPVGTWDPDPVRFPDGLAPVSARAHELGMKSIVWFEPERVMPGTWLYENQPEWLLQPASGDPQFGGAARVFDFGNPDARAWAISHFDGLIKSQGIDVYREDFNIDPLNFWNAADVPAAGSARQFSGEQGVGNWRYQDLFDGEWADIQTFTPVGYLGKPEWHDPAGGYVWPGGLHPGPANDTALAWVAPEDGVVGVRSRVSKVDPSGDGVVVSIQLNGTTLWGPTTLAGPDTAGVAADLDDIAVTQGDVLRFVINRGAAFGSDSTLWSPVVAYAADLAAVVTQYGYAQARYVSGHLAFWAELRKRNPGLFIDNCASGGRRMDLLSLRQSIVLLRSDWVLQYVGEQAATYGVSSWVPLTGTAARITGSSLDRYNARSAMAPSFHLALDPRVPDADWEELRRMAFEWESIKDAYLGDFVPLTPYSVDESTQLAYQFASTDGKTGFVQAFRRSTNSSDRLTMRIRGIQKNGRYEFRDLETGRAWRRTGRQLLADGIYAELPTAPYATTIRYRRL